MYEDGDLKKLATFLIKEGVEVKRYGNQYMFPLIGKGSITLRQSTKGKNWLHYVGLYRLDVRHHEIYWEDVTDSWGELKDFIINTVNY